MQRPSPGTTAVTGGGHLSGSASSPTEPRQESLPPGWAIARALETYDAMQEYLYVGDAPSLYREQHPRGDDDRPYATEWPFSQAYIATLDLVGAQVPGRPFEDDLADRAITQERYWNEQGGSTGLPGYDSYLRPPYGDGGDLFYDDNEWVALAKVQEHLVTGSAPALTRAKEIFELVLSGWDTDASHAAPGGVFWTQASSSTERNTVSTMPAAQLAVRLHMISGEDRYLAWARRLAGWTDAHLLAPNGLYWDSIALDGRVDERHYSYNQGVPVGAYTLLYRATGESEYRHKAEAVADASYTHFVTEGRLNDHPVAFNAIYFKNLLLLESVTGGEKYRRAMERYADRQWREVRDPATGLFPSDGGVTPLLDQAAMVQIYATLAWPTGTVPALY